jgi:hypothetical protein
MGKVMMVVMDLKQFWIAVEKVREGCMFVYNRHALFQP